MDPSIRQGVIDNILNADLLHDEELRHNPLAIRAAEDLSPAERACILREIVGRCKPHFKYIPAFVSIQEEMQKWSFDTASETRRSTDTRIAKFPEQFTEKTRCVRLLFLSHGSPQADLLLTQDGRLIKWVHEYDCYSHAGGVHDWVYNKYATKSEFLLVNDDDLKTILVPKIFIYFLSFLREMVAHCIAEREKRLESMRALWLFLSQVNTNVYSREEVSGKYRQGDRNLPR